MAKFVKRRATTAADIAYACDNAALGTRVFRPQMYPHPGLYPMRGETARAGQPSSGMSLTRRASGSPCIRDLRRSGRGGVIPRMTELRLSAPW